MTHIGKRVITIACESSMLRIGDPGFVIESGEHVFFASYVDVYPTQRLIHQTIVQ